MVKLVYTYALGAYGFGRGGSSPLSRTMKSKTTVYDGFLFHNVMRMDFGSPRNFDVVKIGSGGSHSRTKPKENSFSFWRGGGGAVGDSSSLAHQKREKFGIVDRNGNVFCLVFST